MKNALFASLLIPTLLLAGCANSPESVPAPLAAQGGGYPAEPYYGFTTVRDIAISVVGGGGPGAQGQQLEATIQVTNLWTRSGRTIYVSARDLIWGKQVYLNGILTNEIAIYVPANSTVNVNLRPAVSNVGPYTTTVSYTVVAYDPQRQEKSVNKSASFTYWYNPFG